MFVLTLTLDSRDHNYIDDEISISLVKDRLAREGLEMIEDQDRIPEYQSFNCLGTGSQ